MFSFTVTTIASSTATLSDAICRGALDPTPLRAPPGVATEIELLAPGAALTATPRVFVGPAQRT